MTLGMGSWNNRLRIHEFLVLEQHRRKGVDELLLDKAKQIAKEKDCRAIASGAQTNNFGAIEFYKKQGFKLNGCDMNGLSQR
ncbi:hypothetical protein AS159_01560 [Thermotoga sp. Ku-13t]|nr:hypothetical protein AS159_01560 [Thermotoga sp. Ku-13t]